MNIKEITVGVQRIINLGNYENVRYECTATAEVDINDDPAEVSDSLKEFCRAQVGAELERLKPSKK